MVGSAIVRRLLSVGYDVVLQPTREELDLTDQAAVFNWIGRERPDYVFIAAAKVGGIVANATAPADFLYLNLVIETNILGACHAADVNSVMFFGSSCIYPRDCPQPIREDYLLTGPLEPTNEAYAIAKIAGLKLAESYRRQYGRQYVSVMPTNLYGPNDNYDLTTSHVLPALLRKAHVAMASGQSELDVWGSGSPRREFLHVDDLADAAVHMMETGYDGPVVNVGVGEDISIGDLARLVANIVGFSGHIVFNAERPDGTPRKLLDISRLAATGWKARIPLAAGVAQTYSEVSREWELESTTTP
jgi:GDP-L-fucose synthase